MKTIQDVKIEFNKVVESLKQSQTEIKLKIDNSVSQTKQKPKGISHSHTGSSGRENNRSLGQGRGIGSKKMLNLKCSKTTFLALSSTYSPSFLLTMSTFLVIGNYSYTQ